MPTVGQFQFFQATLTESQRSLTNDQQLFKAMEDNERK
jgi:hypothetical protein